MKKFGAIILVLALVLAVFPMTALAAEYSCAFGAGDNTVTENGITATGSVSASPIEEGEPVTVTVTFSGTATKSGKYTVTLTSASDVPGLSETEVTANVAAGAKPSSITFNTFVMPDAAVSDLVLGMTFTASDAILSAADIVFDSVDEGYNRPAAKNIVIKNSGGTDATLVNATLTSGASDFDLVSTSNATIAGDSTFNSNTWTIQPVRRLLEGRYYATIRVAYYDGSANKTLDIPVSFRVYDDYYWGGGGNLINTITLTPSSNPYNGYGDLKLRSSGFYNHFLSLSLNGTRLTQGTDYTVENISGQAQFTVFESTLRGIGSSARFTAAFSSGSASTTVTIGTYIPDPVINPPKTGDASSLMGIGLVLLACALAATVRKVRVRAK